jgi:hypothetical protein
VRLTAHLDRFAALWDQCHAFVVERQMAFGKTRNPEAVMLAHHVQSYFAIRYAQFKPCVEFPAYHKTQALGAPRGLGARGRKQWAVATCRALLENDATAAPWRAFFEAHRKQDDLADVLLQAEAFRRCGFSAGL